MYKQRSDWPPAPPGRSPAVALRARELVRARRHVGGGQAQRGAGQRRRHGHGARAPAPARAALAALGRVHLQRAASVAGPPPRPRLAPRGERTDRLRFEDCRFSCASFDRLPQHFFEYTKINASVTQLLKTYTR